MKPELIEIVAIHGIDRVRTCRRYDARGCRAKIASRVDAGEQSISAITARVARNAIRSVGCKVGSLVIPVKSSSMVNQVNKEYLLMLAILLLSGYYVFF